MTPARHLRAAALLASLAAVAVAPASLAQVTATESFETFRLVDWGGEVFVDSFYFQDTDERPGAPSVTHSELFSQQGVELWGRGHIYHPNLLDWSGSVRLGVAVDQVDIGEDQGTSVGELLGYNLTADVLKEKPISGRVFGSWRQQFLGRSFTRPVQIDRRVEGFEVRYRSPITASILFEHLDSTEDSAQRFNTEESFRTRLTLTDTRDRDLYSQLMVEHEDIDETLTFSDPETGPLFTQNLDETRDELNFINRYVFGEGELKHHLSGNARLLRRRGFFDNDSVLINQRLDLQHTETLSSFYAGAFNYDRSDVQRQQSLQGEAGLRKRFYDSLILTGRVAALDRDFEDGSESSIGFFADADYTKKTPIGVYSTRLTVGRRYEQEQFDGGQRSVTDDAVTLSGIGFEPLNVPGALPGTVVVTDAANAVLFVEGVDYELRRTGAITEIRRLVGGAIQDNQVVLVDYVASAATDAEFHTDILSWGHRLALDAVPVALYMQYNLRNEVLDSGTNPLNLQRDERWLFGAELTLRDLLAESTALVISGEYERRELRLSPGWDAYRARATYSHRLSDQAFASLSAHYEMLTFRDAEEFNLEPGRDFLESYGANAAVTSKIGRNLLLKLEALYLHSTGRNEDELIRIGPSLVYSIGELELSLGGYQAFYEQEDSEGQTTYVTFNLTRKF